MKKALSLMLTVIMLLSLCALPVLAETTADETMAEETTAEAAEAEATEAAAEDETEAAAPDAPHEKGVLVVGTETLSGKFSEFYADSVYDRNIADMTQISLLYNDRASNYILNGKDGYDAEYNGTNYHYLTPANVDIDPAEDGSTTTYTITLRDDLKFSDGEPLTADDVIFNMYVYADPAYAGSTTFSAMAIQGMQDYRTQTSSEVHDKYASFFDDIVAAGPDYTVAEGDGFSQELYDAVWNQLNAAWTTATQDIVDYVLANYVDYASDIDSTPEDVQANDGLKVALGMAEWGFASFEDGKLTVPMAEGEDPLTFDLKESFPTNDDYAAAAKAKYGNDFFAFFDAEATGNPLGLSQEEMKANFILENGSQDESMAGQGVPNISGITKLDDYTVRVVTDGFDASAIEKLGLPIGPLHYYGDPAQYDYENNKFGHPFNDLSLIDAKGAEPMGAGPYIFKEYKNRTVYYEANPYYFRGEPKIKFLQFKETNQNDFVKGVVGGSIDIADPSFSDQTIKEIKSENSNSDLTGDKIMTVGIDTLGYGYIGLNAATMNVAGDPASEASKDLRKGFATVIAAWRELANDSYYGERASVINYPISNTSWAAPQPADEGYEVAYSKDVDGNPIYTSDMDNDQKVEAALQAAIGFFKAAGYTWDEAAGKFTAAPEGAKMTYEVIIPANGTGDHPAVNLITNAKTTLEKIGLSIKVNDPADSNVLWDSLDAGTQEMWTAAWSATIDPDMYQIYHSSSVPGLGGSESNNYRIQDPQLDELIMEGRTSADQSFRKATYKAAMDIIKDWGVEIPNYQRQDCIVFSTERVNTETLPKDMTTFYGWMAAIEGIELK